MNGITFQRAQGGLKRRAEGDPDYDWLYGISSPSRVGNPLYQPLYDVCSPTYKGHEDLT